MGRDSTQQAIGSRLESRPSRGGVGNDDLVLWVESRGAVVAGDSLIDRGSGLEIPEDWLDQGHVREQVAEGLRPLLERPVEHVLATHGGPMDRAALERALA